MECCKVLLVEDDEVLRRVITVQLQRHGYEASAACQAEEALLLLERSAYDVLLTDLNLPGLSGLDLLKRARTHHPEMAVIVMTAYATVQTAVEAMKMGAYDYLTKPVHPYELNAIIMRASERRRLLQEVSLLRSALDRKYGFENLIGSSPVFESTLDLAARVANTDATILITGETGTGKEVLAKAIHFNSPRRDRPMVTINCGAIPRELLESELFGHVKGSFTGAFTHKKGKVEMADGGTVFLDEIGEMPLELQVRVLRLIQEHEIEKVGASLPTKVDVRIIAATHRDLETQVKSGFFREDLYYRLLVVPIRMPALRERPDDIPELVQHFFEAHRRKHGRLDLGLAPGVLPVMRGYSWPGNVRELENAIERMVLLCRGAEIGLGDLPDSVRHTMASPGASQLDLPQEGASLQHMERELIIQALRKYNGNQSSAARYLSISRRTLAYRLKKYNIASGRAAKLA